MNKFNALAAIQRAVLDSEAIGPADSAAPAIPGLQSQAWYAQFADIATHFSPAAAATTYAEQGLYDTAPTMVTLKKFKTVDIVVNENTFIVEGIGGANTGAFKVTGTFKIAGNADAVRGFMNEIKFNRSIWVVKAAGGKRYLIGDGLNGRYATVQPKFDFLKDEDGGVVGAEIVVSAVQNQMIELDSTVTIPV